MSDPKILTFIGTAEAGGSTQAQAGKSLQVEINSAVTLSWKTSGADSVTLVGPIDGGLKSLGANDSLEVKAGLADSDYVLIAKSGDTSSSIATVAVSAHPPDEVVSTHGEAESGVSTQIVIPINGHIYDGDLGKWSGTYVEIELKVTIEAEGSLLVGKGVGEPAEDAEGKALKIQPSGYDDGWKHSVGMHIGKQLGPFKITLEDFRASATISKEGVNVAIEIEGSIYGVSAKCTFTLVKVDEKWKRLKAMEAELEISIPFFTVPKVGIGPDMAIGDMKVAPHLKGTISPNWKAIALQIAKKLGIKVAEKTLEGAAEGTAEDLAADAAASGAEDVAAEAAGETAAEGAGETAAEDALTDTVVDAAGADATAAEAGEDVAMVAGIDVLVASGALLGMIWITVKVFEDMEFQQWREEAAGKIDELTAQYLEGYRKGLMQEATPTDEPGKTAWPRGHDRFLILKAQFYKWFKANQPQTKKSDVDAAIAQSIRDNWSGEKTTATPVGDGMVQVDTSEKGIAEPLCENTAKATVFAAWAKEGHGGITDWPDRGNAFLSVFGHDPHHEESEMSDFEKTVWEKIYGKEYADP